MESPKEIRPQPGFQEQFLASGADITIGGGAAGCGKTYIEEVAPLPWVHLKDFTAVLFRRTTVQITNPGGPWDQSMQIYPDFGATSTMRPLRWTFPSGATVSMAHLEYEKDMFDWQGAQVALMIFDELTHFCLTPDHDVLTKRGWVPIAEVMEGDAVLARVGSGAQFRRVKAMNAFDYDGEIVDVFQRNGVSARMTPNHRVLVQRQDEQESLGFVRADHLEKTVQSVPRRAIVDRPDNITPVEFSRSKASRGIGKNQNSVTSCPRDVWLRFLGWYLSEGSTSSMDASPIVRIAQTKPAPDLDEVMIALPWRSSPEKRGGWRVCSRQLSEILKPMGDTYTKRVPRWVAEECSPRQIRLFLDSFIAGDGHRQPSGGVTIGLANRGLRDDLHELCILAGFIGTSHDGKDWTKRFDVFTLNISHDGRGDVQVKPKSTKRIPFKGRVYCPSVDCPSLPDFTRGGYKREEVPGGNFLVRHRGRVHFTGNTEEQFWYLQSRNRSMCGIRPYTLGTCNPDPDSWVAKLIAWWLDDEGDPIPARSGVLRYFTRWQGEMIWGDNPEEVKSKLPPGVNLPDERIQTLTFVPGKLEENKILEKADPTYRGKLEAMSRVSRARLLNGNWKARAVSGSYFRRSDVHMLDAVPTNLAAVTRRWDLAASEPTEAYPDPDFTCGVKLGKYPNGRFVVLHAELQRIRANDVRELIKRMAVDDGKRCSIGVPQDPAQAGKDQSESYVRDLAGFVAYAEKESGSKEVRAEPCAAQWQHQNIDVVKGSWNDAFFAQLEAFPDHKVHDDAVDALAGAFHRLVSKGATMADIL